MVNKELFSKALDSTDEGVLIASVSQRRGGEIVYVNRAFERMFECSSKKLIGKGLTFLRRLSREKCIGDAVRRAIQLGKSEHHMVELMTRRGNAFCSRLCISPICDSGGCVSHLILVSHDVSELQAYRRQVEKQNQFLAEQNIELEALATHDPLTGVYNRRYFDAEFKRALAVHQRQQMPLSLAFFDVDYFKDYNDYYGHAAGDRVLVSVAAIIQSHFFRAGDVVARYGGEEFVVLSSAEGDKAEFHSHIERVRKDVEALAMCHMKSQAAPVVTISAGIYCDVPNGSSELGAIVEAADRNMYHAKAGGRNQVSCG